MKARNYPSNAATGRILGYETCAVSADAYTAARDTSDACYNLAAHGSLQVGQEPNPGAGETQWLIYRSYVSFDTSVIGTLTLNGACLFMLTGYDTEDSLGVDDSDIVVYNFDSDADLCGANQEANYDGAYGGAAILEGALFSNTTGIQNSTWYHLEVSTSNISTTGSTTYTIVCKADVDNDNSKDVGDIWFEAAWPDYVYLQLDVPGGFVWIF